MSDKEKIRDTNPDEPSPSGSAPTPTLGLITVRKSCEVLADRLQQWIVDGAHPPGTPLPAERDLALTTGLSRGSVREAMRILEARGMVQTRPGRYGGTVVARPSDTDLGTHIERFAKSHRVSLRALIEARRALAPMIAQLAARHRTDEDLEILHGISDRLDAAAARDVPRFLAENANWHAALARASHNDLLRAFTASISDLMWEASRIENFASDDVRQLVTIAHRRMLKAIELRDAETAYRRAERDVAAYERHLEALLGRDALDKPGPFVPVTRRVAGQP